MEHYFIDKDGKKRKAKWVECDNCGIGFLKGLRFIKEGRLNFCCQKCASQYKSKQSNVELTCAFCNKSFKRKVSSLVSSKNGIYFCSRICKDNAMKRENWNENIMSCFPSHYGSGNGDWSYRRIAFDNYPNKCEKCRYNEHSEILQVHHIDGDRTNNKKENLMILCPNCHWSVTLKYIFVNENREFVENW